MMMEEYIVVLFPPLLVSRCRCIVQMSASNVSGFADPHRSTVYRTFAMHEIASSVCKRVARELHILKEAACRKTIILDL